MTPLVTVAHFMLWPNREPIACVCEAGHDHTPEETLLDGRSLAHPTLCVCGHPASDHFEPDNPNEFHECESQEDHANAALHPSLAGPCYCMNLEPAEPTPRDS